MIALLLSLILPPCEEATYVPTPQWKVNVVDKPYMQGKFNTLVLDEEQIAWIVHVYADGCWKEAHTLPKADAPTLKEAKRYACGVWHAKGLK